MMDDLISRQAAIDAVENIDCSNRVGISTLKCEAIDDAINAIKALPSAQPNLQPTCNQLATDCISRQVVLDWLNDEWDGMVLSVFEGIRNLPSAQPEEEIIYCGECKHMMPNGRCRQFADKSIRPSASDFCSAGERRTDG